MAIHINKDEGKLFSKALNKGNADNIITVYSRSRFYFWFQIEAMKKGLKIRWPLAAYVAASTIQQAAIWDTLLTNNEIEKFVYSGNQVILDDVISKLKSALSNDELKKPEKALEWDIETLYEEQHLIHGLYFQLSKKEIELLENIAKGKLYGFEWIGDIASHSEMNKFSFDSRNLENTISNQLENNVIKPFFPKSFDLKNIKDRCDYGFMIANTIFKGADVPFKEPSSINDSYKLKKRKSKIYCYSLNKVRTMDTIHSLNSIIYDQSPNIKEIVKIFKVIKTQKTQSPRKYRKAIFMINYDRRIIRRIAEIDFRDNSSNEIGKKIQLFLNNQSKKVYKDAIKYIKETYTTGGDPVYWNK